MPQGLRVHREGAVWLSGVNAVTGYPASCYSCIMLVVRTESGLVVGVVTPGIRDHLAATARLEADEVAAADSGR